MIRETPDFWTMPDAELAAAYRTLLAVTEFSDATEEQLLFCEDAIMQRIDAPEDADPSVDPRWAQAAVDFADRVLA